MNAAKESRGVTEGSTTSPTFSVIIPTYNRQDLLVQAIASVLSQTEDIYEIIVVNDGGAPPLLPRDPRLRLVEQENLGLAAARNHGLRVARGKYVAFLDDDDTLDPARVSIALEGLLRGAPVSLCSKSYGATATEDVTLFLRGSGLHAGQFAVARECCLPFREDFRHTEDFEWAIRMQVYPWTCIDRVGYLVRQHNGPRLTDDIPLMLQSRLRLLEVHEGWFREHTPALHYQLRFIAAMALQSGASSVARQALWRAAVVRPDLRTLSWLALSYLPGARYAAQLRNA